MPKKKKKSKKSKSKKIKIKKIKKVKKPKKVKKAKSVSFKPEKVDYSKVRHETSVDQSDRHVHFNFRRATLS